MMRFAMGKAGSRKIKLRWWDTVSRNDKNELSEIIAENPGHCFAARIALEAPIDTPHRIWERLPALSFTTCDAAQTSRLSKIPIVVYARPLSPWLRRSKSKTP